jgi:outer membrane receptor for ferrienterochelin and colicin
VQLLAMASQDQLVDWFVNPALGDPPSGTAALTTQFYRVILSADSKLSDDFSTRIVVGGGSDENQQATPSFDVTTAMLQVRPSVRWRWSDSFVVDIGGQYIAQQLQGTVSRAAAPGPGTAAPITIPQTTGTIVGGYVGATWNWFDDFQMLPGIRFENFSQTGETIGDPRLGARWRLMKDSPGVAELTLKASAGVYHQAPSLLQTSAQLGNPLLTSEDSVQYLGGVEYRPTKKLLIDVDGFYSSLENVIVDSSVVTRTGGVPVPQVFSNGGSGETRGLEIFVQQQLWNNLEGWLYYTFAVSDLSTATNGSEVLSPYDQTHVLGTVLAYALPAQWHVRGRFQYASGFPTTAIIGSVFDSSTNSYVSLPGATLGDRTPDFSQLDLRVDKVWETKAAKITAYVDVRNVYNRANLVTQYSYNFDYSQRFARSGVPILPMVGARVDF